MTWCNQGCFIPSKALCSGSWRRGIHCLRLSHEESRSLIPSLFSTSFTHVHAWLSRRVPYAIVEQICARSAAHTTLRHQSRLRIFFCNLRKAQGAYPLALTIESSIVTTDYVHRACLLVHHVALATELTFCCVAFFTASGRWGEYALFSLYALALVGFCLLDGALLITLLAYFAELVEPLVVMEVISRLEHLRMNFALTWLLEVLEFPGMKEDRNLWSILAKPLSLTCRVGPHYQSPNRPASARTGVSLFHPGPWSLYRPSPRVSSTLCLDWYAASA